VYNDTQTNNYNKNMITIKISYEGGVAVYRQIVDQISHMVASGQLPENSELPPIRKLAKTILVNPNTIAKAYNELERNGIIYKKSGVGCFVNEHKSPFSDEERHKIIEDYVQQLLVKAYQLEFSHEDIIAKIERQIANQKLTNKNSKIKRG
jgi:GntR family transcriptional regulator